MADEQTTQAAEQTGAEQAPPIADVQAPPEKGMHEMSREERREFLESGKAPTKAKEADGTTSDSSTDPAKGQKAAETAAKDSKPASETGDPAKTPKARNNEENRVAELLEERRRDRRENDELRRRLEALEKGTAPKSDAKADSSTAAATSATSKIDPKRLGADGVPDIDKYAENELPQFFKDLVTYGREQANADFTNHLSEREKAHLEQAENHREMDRVVNQAADRMEADEKAHPGIREKVHRGLLELVPMRMLSDDERKTANRDHFMKDCIVFESDHPWQLSAFYSTDEGWAEWQSMRQMDRRGIERTIARRDLLLGQSTTGATADAKAPAKTFTKAPAPPDKGGAKSTGEADAAAAAVKAGDFSAFQAELDEREPETARRFGRRRG